VNKLKFSLVYSSNKILIPLWNLHSYSRQYMSACIIMQFLPPRSLLMLCTTCTKLQNTLQRGMFCCWESIKTVFGRGYEPDPTGELTTLPQIPSRLGRGVDTLPIPTISPLDAFGVSTWAPSTLQSWRPRRLAFGLFDAS